MNTQKISTRDLVLIALITSITCILAPCSLSIPISPVPISLTNLVLYFSIYILGWKYATISYIVYLLLGMAGLPVFSGFSGGIGKLAGPTGGYLIGFAFLAVISGLFVEKYKGNRPAAFLGMILGTAVCYLFGTAWLSWQLGQTFVQGLFIGVIPYLPGDLVKMVAAIILAPQLVRRIHKAVL